MTGIYFSGTGNTKHCVETFLKLYDKNSAAISIEAPDVLDILSVHDTIVLGYPAYFSNVPKIVQDFISENSSCFQNKKVFIIVTMALFSGDGTGCTARLLKKCGANVIGGLHLKMPDSIGDEKILKKSIQANREIILRAEEKIAQSVQELKNKTPPQEGLSFPHHMAGLFGQRLWFYKKTATYKKKPNVDKEKCSGCGLCVRLCPMKNIAMQDEKAVSHDRCTLCYRCFSHCPTKALTILGRRVYEQCLCENYK